LERFISCFGWPYRSLDCYSNDFINRSRIRKIMGEVISGAYPAPASTEPIVETVEVEVEDEVVDE
jgi:hypothetical protein